MPFNHCSTHAMLQHSTLHLLPPPHLHPLYHDAPNTFTQPQHETVTTQQHTQHHTGESELEETNHCSTHTRLQHSTLHLLPPPPLHPLVHDAPSTFTQPQHETATTQQHTQYRIEESEMAESQVNCSVRTICCSDGEHDGMGLGGGGKEVGGGSPSSR
jgi:hypothetical protein